MKMLKVISKKINGKIYYKYILNIPCELVEKSGFYDKYLIGKVENGKLILEIK